MYCFNLESLPRLHHTDVRSNRLRIILGCPAFLRNGGDNEVKKKRCLVLK